MADTIGKKTFPKEIAREVKYALSYYPELKEISITFKFKDNIKKSFMLAQPKISGFFNQKEECGYNIFISRRVTIEGEEFSVIEVPEPVLIGWLGHELGHIMDYLNRSNLEMIGFGLRYISSKNFIRKAERAADTYAINHGMSDYILETKNFILNHSRLSERYKSRIRNLYLSPEETLDLINEFSDSRENQKMKSRS